MLILTLVLACSSSPTGPQPDTMAAASAAATFCTMVEGIDQECLRNGASVTALGHELVFSAIRDKDVSVSGQLTAEYTFDATVDGSPLPMGALITASGPGEAGAAEKAANDWGSIYGAPLADRYLEQGTLTVLQSLYDEASPPPAFEQGGWVAYPGWIYLMGKQKQRRTVKLGPLLEQLQPTIGAWDAAPGVTHTLLVSFSFRPGYAPDGQCVLDGQPSEALCDQALGYDWPEPGDGGYVVKQFFVLTPGTLAPSEDS